MRRNDPEDVSPSNPPWLPDHPALEPYRALAHRLPSSHLPTARDLNEAGLPGQLNHAGQPIRFCDSRELDLGDGDGAYEREIARSGQVSTRPGSQHDLCNALVWARFPALKAALNQRHLEALPDSRPGRRGPVRDTLTLFDECGMIVACAEREPLERLARHDWPGLFGNRGEAWPVHLSLWMFGHGNLEKLQRPYPGLIAQCLLLHTVQPFAEPDPVPALDQALAALWLSPDGPVKPGDLCAFPCMGVPGWWADAQDGSFYANQEVFRPPRPGRPVPPLWSLPASSRRKGR